MEKLTSLKSKTKELNFVWGRISKLAIAIKITENFTVLIGKGKFINGIKTIICSVFIKLQISPREVLMIRFNISPKETDTPSEEAKVFVTLSFVKKAISSTI